MLECLSADDAQIRYLAILLIAWLFERSAKFRQLLCDDFIEAVAPLLECHSFDPVRMQVVELTVGNNLERPLPPPQRFATLLR